MDSSVNDTSSINGRQVSVIVAPKSNPIVVPPETDQMIKALTGNPWATALMMQYTAAATARFPSTDHQQPNKQLFPSIQPTQTFGALLKAAMRNRNASNGSSFSTSTNATIHHQSQTSNAAAAPNRMSYPREFKLLVIGYYFNNGQNKYRTCKEFQITKSMLNGWLQKVDKIQQSRPGSLKSGRSGRKPQFPQVESELYKVYLAYLEQGKKVGNRWLRDTAKCIAQRRCSSDELNGMCQFSERWLCNFKKRFGINLTKDWNDKPSQPDETSSGNNEEETLSKSTTLDSNQPSPDTTVDAKIPIEDIKPDIITAVPIQVRSKMIIYEPGKRGRKVQFPQVEKALFKKLRAKQTDGDRISNRWLQDEARRLAIELCPQLFTDTFKSARCMFSEHWLHNFKKRYGITLKQSSPKLDEQNPDSPLNLVMSEPVSSSDDIGKEGKTKSDGHGNVIDDLPTMVPLPKSTIPSAINLTEWYTQVSTMVGNGDTQIKT